ALSIRNAFADWSATDERAPCEYQKPKCGIQIDTGAESPCGMGVLGGYLAGDIILRTCLSQKPSF
ncbi:hypothetical protein, partial [Paraburkholderia sp. SIMBA_027]|uniref:hypothetical protein n=1 Tax=Paraburkholderia sp. SIMBA_027 TaxID=3085770 RepID=UPI00397BB814